LGRWSRSGRFLDGGSRLLGFGDGGVAVGLNGSGGRSGLGLRGRGEQPRSGLGDVVGGELFYGAWERGLGGGSGDGGRRSGLTCRCRWGFGSRGRLGLGGLNFRLSGLVGIVALDGLLLQESENVVEHKIAVGLLSEEKGLDKLAPGLAAVRHLTDDLDDDSTICRSLRIYRVNEDLAVLKTNRSDFLMDFLQNRADWSAAWMDGSRRT
jgi:hypothetical protein